MINLGSNTVISNGDPVRGREALCALELGVATELFMTPTAQLCDYVLPATSFLEMDHLCGGFRHRVDARTHVQYRRRAVEPLAERRSDTWFVFELAKRMGFGDDFWGGDVEAAYSYQLEPTGMTLDALRAHPGGVTLESPRRYRKYAETDEEGRRKGFNNPSGKVEIYSHRFAQHGFPPLPEYEEPALSPTSRPDLAAEYPLVLTNAKFTTFIHSQQRALPSLRKAAPEPSAELHPDTAGGARHRAQAMDDRGKPEGRREGAGEPHRPDHPRRGLCATRLVAALPGAGASGPRPLFRARSQPQRAGGLGTPGPHQRVAAAPVVSVPCASGRRLIK